MADPARKLPENVPGEFFVDDTCIDCDTCRQLSPRVFGELRDYSFVRSQPRTDEERRQTLHAVVSCPTGSIGSAGRSDARLVLDDFPLALERPVFYCGFNSPKSYGGNSYFVQHPEGNWLIDSPKFLPRLAKRIEALGGLRRIFLTHSDDVADAERWARHFGAERIIHRAELASQPGAERVLEGEAPMPLGDDFLAIPTPGHTRGHCVLLFRERFLFTGDHLWWDRDDRRLGASSSYCWYSWDRQIESMARLAGFRFEWVLPGHGQRVQLPCETMRTAIEALVARMRGVPEPAGA